MISVLGIGTLFFMGNEEWRVADALYYSVTLKSSTSDRDLWAEKFSSQVFLLLYQWAFITAVMNIISHLCALRIEVLELLRIQAIEDKSKNLSSLAIDSSFYTGQDIDQFEFLVKLLVHLEVLDNEADVQKWLCAIQEFSRNQEGRLSRADILAFAESERRKRLALDGDLRVTPTKPPGVNPIHASSSRLETPCRSSPTRGNENVVTPFSPATAPPSTRRFSPVKSMQLSVGRSLSVDSNRYPRHGGEDVPLLHMASSYQSADPITRGVFGLTAEDRTTSIGYAHLSDQDIDELLL
eukprot:CAMPEP_0185027500 /NCGR_PEP_ID=MMETSP1103-20130426/12617_1 /TAXON_ID=36769 /ORGANISM="Paraphysomonas bandaiensis, Strain Caron Lab Isolate" /LENGTH=295 /DNA_ID=CAMNT_0027561525 /DNA_START=566 /DNA_END=1453 /DNA_ORIENTATION=-